ncbi:type II secretion system protein GspD [Pseudoluteimonas lycopersici]|uniref:Type II secretion system protein GspD n=1 Tax=Pseudoluteimonas lycopersici TaxID=1324796 RepID=A0A516V7F2_9GAMM|nr:type II secretion system secretin GspD [Lysobacter lycopersici]QDQ74472.1 type II secretion system protein GspD [Lysobacter lycopersici]
MKLRQPFAAAFAACLLALLAACASMPPPIVQRNGAPGASAAGVAGATTTTTTADGGIVNGAEPIPEQDAVPRAVIHRGSGRTINTEAANAPPPGFAASTGEASFNFEGSPIQAVVKGILGDMLGQNFTIAPGVTGTVTLNVQKVSPAAAFTLLEQVLSWNNARMVYTNGIYNIVPNDQALAGTVAPRTGPPTMSRGFEVRAVPLRYISATEMEKLLKPYARPNAIVSVDPGRNVITLAGTNTELENYLRTVQIFDVDWMSSMSVGVFPLQSGKATDVVSDLEKVFGEQGKSPVAGMFRFMPLEGANAVLVITPQPAYLDQIQQWLDRIDSAGGGVRLYSYELKYIRAKDLAQRLSEVFGGSGGQGGDNGGAPSLMPGTQPTQVGDSGIDGDSRDAGTTDMGGSSSGMGGDSGSPGGNLGSLSLNQSSNGNGSVTLQVQGDKVGVSAVDETNSLLVRSTPQAWKSIREVIDQLDVMPMQVHIEAQIAQVQLSGDLNYGVNWYFNNALTGVLPTAVDGIRSATGSDGGQYTIFSGSAVAVLNALDKVTDVRILSTPSVFVRNNSEADLNVGENIPIQSTTFNSDTNTNGTISQVQYLQTGKILKVRPRVTKDGMVFLDLVQEISSAGNVSTACVGTACNPRISVSKLKTEAAVQSGQTVMLAGLIDDQVEHGSSGLPGLSRIPIIGGLFGTQKSNKSRSETIILITPTIVRNAQEAADLTDEYSRRFRAMEPLQQPPSNRK